MAKKKSIVEDATAEGLLKENTETQIPIESGNWVDDLKEGDLLYSASYERDDEGKEQVKVLTLKFKEYEKKAVVDENTRMAILVPIINGEETESISLPSQNIRTGYASTKVGAIRAFYEALSHMADVVKETLDKVEAEDNPQQIQVY